MHEKLVGFGRIHENKTFFWNEKLFFKFLIYFLLLFEVLEETEYF